MAIDDMTTATHWTRLWNNKYDWTWGAADGMQSRLGPNGYSYWCFGDTILGYPNPADTSFDSARIMVSNTIVMQKGAELGPACYGNGTAAVPDVTVNSILRQFWVTDIIFPSPIKDKAYALTQRHHNDISLGTVVDGTYLAEFDVDGSGRLTFNRLYDTPTTGLDTLDVLEIQWAQCMVELGGYIYVYGRNDPGAGGGYTSGSRTYVARVPAAMLTNKYAWQMWRGTGWVAGRSSTALAVAKKAAVPILDGLGTSVRYDAANSRFLMAHKPSGIFGSNVEIWASANPQGAFTLKQTVSAPGGTSPGGHSFVTYNPTLHLEAALASGYTLLSVSHNGSFSDIFSERSLYHPAWSEVNIPL